MRNRGKPQKPAMARKPAIRDDGRRVTLPRALSKLGHSSRTQAEKLIAEGRVSVDGRVVTAAETWVDLDRAVIAVDGQRVVAERFVYLMLNKPRGLVTTRHDPEGRATVYDCLKHLDHGHLSPVGRLDKASEGLLLFTNDTRFAQALLDPGTHVPKTYHVQMDRIPAEADLMALAAGVTEGGEFLKARSLRLLREGGRNAWVEVVLEEGKNRQIRRMLETRGIGCLRLVRVSMGNLALGDLPKGEARPLSDTEIAALKALATPEKPRLRR